MLERVTYQSASQNPDNYGSDPTRLLVFTANDGNGSFNVGTATETIQITAVNDPPTLSGVDTSIAVAPTDTATLSPSVTITDADDTLLQSATVQITGGTFVGDGDVLSATAVGDHLSIFLNGNRLMSTRCDGCSMSSFIRSSRFVPPWMNFAPVTDAAATAPLGSLARS